MGSSTIEDVVLYNALPDIERVNQGKMENGHTKDRIDAKRIFNDQGSTCQAGVDLGLILSLARRKSSIYSRMIESREKTGRLAFFTTNS